MLIVPAAALCICPQDVLCFVLACERRVPASAGTVLEKLTFVQKVTKYMVCETIIKLNYMEKILLSCPLLYLNGTVTNELLKGEKVIAIVVENTLMSLKNQIRMSYRGAERECENLTLPTDTTVIFL